MNPHTQQGRRSWVSGASLILAAALTAGACGSSPESSTASTAAAGAAPVASATSPGTADTCRLLTPADIAEAVGNPVGAGRQEAGPEVCSWDAEPEGGVDVLVMVRLKGSVRESVLCADVRQEAVDGKGLAGIGEAATWKYTGPVGLLAGNELQVCDAKAYVSIGLDGKGDEATMKAAALALARKLLGRL